MASSSSGEKRFMRLARYIPFVVACASTESTLASSSTSPSSAVSGVTTNRRGRHAASVNAFDVRCVESTSAKLSLDGGDADHRRNDLPNGLRANVREIERRLHAKLDRRARIGPRWILHL